MKRLVSLVPVLSWAHRASASLEANLGVRRNLLGMGMGYFEQKSGPLLDQGYAQINFGTDALELPPFFHAYLPAALLSRIPFFGTSSPVFVHSGSSAPAALRMFLQMNAGVTKERVQKISGSDLHQLVSKPSVYEVSGVFQLASGDGLFSIAPFWGSDKCTLFQSGPVTSWAGGQVAFQSLAHRDLFLEALVRKGLSGSSWGMWSVEGGFNLAQRAWVKASYSAYRKEAPNGSNAPVVVEGMETSHPTWMERVKQVGDVIGDAWSAQYETQSEFSLNIRICSRWVGMVGVERVGGKSQIKAGLFLDLRKQSPRSPCRLLNRNLANLKTVVVATDKDVQEISDPEVLLKRTINRSCHLGSDAQGYVEDGEPRLPEHSVFTNASYVQKHQAFAILFKQPLPPALVDQLKNWQTCPAKTVPNPSQLFQFICAPQLDSTGSENGAAVRAEAVLHQELQWRDWIAFDRWSIRCGKPHAL